MGCVYQATNRITGKKYIGKTIRLLDVRRKAHVQTARRGCGAYFHAAMRKYGLEAFDWDVLYQNDDRKLLSEMEREFIRLLNTKTPNGYNLTDGGDGARGCLATPERRAKISAANKGRKLTPEQRARFIAGIKSRKMPPKLGKPCHTPESRAKISAASRGRLKDYKHTPEARAKISAAKQGRKRPPLTEKWRQHIGDAQRGKKRGPMSEAQKAILRERHIGKSCPTVTESNRRRKGYKPTPEARAKMSAALKGKPKSPETKLKLSAAAKTIKKNKANSNVR